METIGGHEGFRKDDSGRRPNIVLILADDMGFSDVGCYGGEISTPNIDRLAEKGIRFSHFYNNAVCMATRASLLTGLYPHQVGAQNRAALRQGDNVTIAEVLRNAGYRTLMSGKWHNGSTRGQIPCDRGFDRYYGLLSGCCNYFNPGLKRDGEPEPAEKKPGDLRPWGIDDRVLHPYTPPNKDFYTTDAFTEKAIEFLDEQGQDEPFFLYLSYCAPHFPMQAWPEDIMKYRGRYLSGWEHIRTERYQRLLETGLLDRSWGISAPDSRVPDWNGMDDSEKDAWDSRMAVYAAMIDRMDRGIGKVLTKIRDMGQEDDTIVIFLSDNGGSGQHFDNGIPPGPMDSYCTVDAPWANVSNTPFRLFKVFDHEGGISTPFLFSWPRVIRNGGGIIRQAGHVIDLMPTLLEAAGAEYPETWNGCRILPQEGRSLLPAILGGEEFGRVLFWELEGCRALRSGRWKIVTQGDGRRHIGMDIEGGHESWELYDMAEDRCETKDLADRHPEIVQELAGLWSGIHERLLQERRECPQ